MKMTNCLLALLLPLAAFAQPEVVDQTPFAYVAVAGRGSFAQVPAAIAALNAEVARVGVKKAGPLTVLYRDKPSVVPEADLRWDVGYPVEEQEAERADLGRLVVVTFPFTRVARTLHHGSYLTTGETIAALKAWVLAHGMVTYNGPVAEQYLPPSEVPPGEDPRVTRILLPVKEPYLTAASAFNYLALAGSGDYQAIREASARLRFLMDWYHVRATGPVFLAYGTAGVASEPPHWEVGQPVHADQPAIGKLALHRFAYPLLASVVHDGSDANIGDTHRAVHTWAQDRGMTAYNGAAFEFYLDRDPDHVPPQDRRTVVSQPVAERAGSGDAPWPPPCFPWNIIGVVPPPPRD